MKLTLIRHGQTEENLKKINAGYYNSKLSSLGVEQASKVGLRFKDEKIYAIYASDLERAQLTAKAIADHHPETAFIIDPLLREQNYSDFELMPYGSMHKAAEKENIPFIKFRPKNGESVEDVRVRIKQFLDKITEKHNGQSIFIVSHGGIISNALLHLLSEPEEAWPKYKTLGNTSVSSIEIENGKAMLKTLNCQKHLE